MTASAAPKEPANRLMRDRLGLIVLACVLWAGLAWYVDDPLNLAGPFDTAQEIVEQAQSATFRKNALSTASAVLQAAAIAVAGGLFLGLLIGNIRLCAIVFEPILVSLYSLPKVTFFPVILLIFGLSGSGKVALGVLHGIVPVMLFTVGAIRTTPPIFERTGRAMGLGFVQRVRFILIPAALPEILTGVRIGLSLTLLGVLVGELFAARSGLGTQLRKAMELADGREIMALAVFLFLVALVMNSAFMALTRRFGGGRQHQR